MLFCSNYAKNYASKIRQGLIAYITPAASLPGNIRFNSAERRSLASEPNKNLMAFTAVRSTKVTEFLIKTRTEVSQKNHHSIFQRVSAARKNICFHPKTVTRNGKGKCLWKVYEEVRPKNNTCIIRPIILSLYNNCYNYRSISHTDQSRLMYTEFLLITSSRGMSWTPHC